MNVDRFIAKILVYSTGERLVLVVNQRTGIPHLETNKYLFQRRKPLLSFKSLKKEADVICLLLNHYGHFVENLTVDAVDRLSFKDIYNVWSGLKRSISGDFVAPSTHMFRWNVFERIFNHLLENALLDLSYKDPLFKNLSSKKNLLSNEVKKLKITTSPRRLKGLDKNIVHKILKITRESSLENPWIKRDRLRNQVIVDVLLRLGVRAGELLKISLDELHLNGSVASITIKRKENESSDPRKDEPRVKTFGRILELDQQLAQDIIRLLKQRNSEKNAKKNKFLFVSNVTGQPLSYDRLIAIIEKIKFKELNDAHLTPHDFRRTWNDMFREFAEDVGIDSEIITQTQNYLQGRMLNSSEAYKYSSRHIERKARESHMKFQNEMFNRVKK